MHETTETAREIFSRIDELDGYEAAVQIGTVGGVTDIERMHGGDGKFIHGNGECLLLSVKRYGDGVDYTYAIYDEGRHMIGCGGGPLESAENADVLINCVTPWAAMPR